jgi:hypothetical protein
VGIHKKEQTLSILVFFGLYRKPCMRNAHVALPQNKEGCIKDIINIFFNGIKTI